MTYKATRRNFDRRANCADLHAQRVVFDCKHGAFLVERLDINRVADGKFVAIDSRADEFVSDNARRRIDFRLAKFVAGLLNDLLATFDARIVELFFERGDNFFGFAFGFANHGGGFFLRLADDVAFRAGNFVAHFGDFFLVLDDLLLTLKNLRVALFVKQTFTFQRGKNFFKILVVGGD